MPPKAGPRPTDAGLVLPYWAEIRHVCEEGGEDPHLFAALLLRESACGWSLTPRGPQGTGDFAPRRRKPAGVPVKEVPGGYLPADGGGWGRGLCQIDIGYWSDWLAHNDWRIPLVSMRFAAKALADNRRHMLESPARINDSMLLERAAYAAYNAGPEHVRRIVLIGDDPDSVTTGGDYSAWILRRAAELRWSLPLNRLPPGDTEC